MRHSGIAALTAAFLFLALIGCRHAKPNDQDLLRVKSANEGRAKPVIFLMADSLMYQAIDRGIREKELPAFQYLIEHGRYYKNLVSSFPTMSVTIDSTLLTGKYPDEHRIPGLTWWSAGDNTRINYGTGPIEVLRHGVNPVLSDAIVHLNGNHLSRNVTTIYEDLARLGLTSGSINGLIYRGAFEHTLTVPGWIRSVTDLPADIQVKGPELLSLGVLSNPLDQVTDLPDGPTNRMGINNRFTIETVKYLVRENKLPDFLFVYLPDMDKALHKRGPSDRKGIRQLDLQLHELLQAFGSPEQALRRSIWIVAGDSGMTQVRSADDSPVVDLPTLLGEDRVWSPGEAGSKKQEYVLAVNETMAYVYLLRPDQSFRDAADRIKQDGRIELIAWKDRDWIYAIRQSIPSYLQYKAKGDLVDPYDQSWTIERGGEVLDIRLDAAAHKLSYGQYPDGLRRLSAALNSHVGRYLVVTAKPGYELADRGSPSHMGGGGHGSLHREESLVPLIVCGTDRQPERLRMVDLKAYLMDLVTREARQPAKSRHSG